MTGNARLVYNPAHRGKHKSKVRPLEVKKRQRIESAKKWVMREHAKLLAKLGERVP